MRRTQAVASVIALTLAAASARGEARCYFGSAHQLRLRLPRVEHGPVIDGALDDSVWTQAAVLDSFTLQKPIEGVPDSLGTQCLALYDDHFIYFGFRCRQDPRTLRAPLVRRDDVNEDFVGVALDTYYDRRRSYVFGADPNGVQFDGVWLEDNGDPDLDPDFLFTSKARRTEHGYEVEMAIPFKVLRFPPHNPLTFGFNAIRQTAYNGGFMWWAPVTANINSAHAQAGTLDSIIGVHPGHNVQINPTFTGSRLGARDDAGFHYDAAQSRSGLDLKTGVSSNLTAAATLTPDFSQVESDAGVVDINQRFAIYFPEKRPFFLEGNEVFSSPLNLVYTRRIADPLYGVKLTGKVDGTTIGVLSAPDRSAGDAVETLPNSANPYRDHDALYDIVRVREDVLKNSYIGLLMGHREQRETYNRGLGADGAIRVNNHNSFIFQHVESWSRERDYRNALASLDSTVSANLSDDVRNQQGAIRSGNASRLEYDYGSKKLDAGTQFTDISPHFAADMGFIQRTNQIDETTWIKPHLIPGNNAWFTKITPGVNVERTWQHGGQSWAGRLTDEKFNPFLDVALPLNADFGFAANRIFTFFNGREFPDQKTVSFYADCSRFNTVRGGVSASAGDAVVFDETVPGHEVDWNAWSDLRITPQLGANLTINGSVVKRSETRTRFADELIQRTRLTYLLTREMSFRWISEFRSERKYDTAGLLATPTRSLSLDLLASYFVRPGTVVYLGYGARLQGPSASGMKLGNSNLFLKLSYMWQG